MGLISLIGLVTTIVKAAIFYFIGDLLRKNEALLVHLGMVKQADLEESRERSDMGIKIAMLGNLLQLLAVILVITGLFSVLFAFTTMSNNVHSFF